MWTFVTENEGKTGALAIVWGRSIGPGLERKEEGGAIWAFPRGNVAYQRDRGTLTPPLYTLPLTLALSVTHLSAAVFSGLPQHSRSLSLAGFRNQRQIGITNNFSVEIFPNEFTFTHLLWVESTCHKPVVQSSLPWMHFERSPHSQRCYGRLWIVEEEERLWSLKEGRSCPAEPLRLSVSSLVVSFSRCRCCCCRPGTGELPDAPPSLSFFSSHRFAIQEILIHRWYPGNTHIS